MVVSIRPGGPAAGRRPGVPDASNPAGTTSPGTRRENSPSPRRWAAAALVVVCVGLPAAVAAVSGSFGLPSMDDWAYRRVAVHFAQTGHLEFYGWVSMSFVGQVLWAWPWLKVLGDHAWVLSASTLPLAGAAVVSAWWLARRLLPAAWAAAAVLLLLVAPGFALNTSTFMTDAPALGAELACLALGAGALRRPAGATLRRSESGGVRTPSGAPPAPSRGAPVAGIRPTLLGLSLLVGLFGYSIREFDLVAPVAVLVCAAAVERGWRRAGVVAAGAALLAVCAGLYEWSLSVPGLWKLTPVAPTLGSFERTAQAYFSVSLFVSPAVAVAAWRRLELRSWRGLLAAAAVLGVGIAVGAGPGLFVGNDVQPRGVGSTLLVGGGRAVLVGWWFWHLLAVLAVMSGAVLAWLLACLAFGALRRWRSWDWASPLAVLGVFAFLAAAGFAAYSLTAVKIFDRYLWPVELPAAVLLLVHARGPAGSSPPRRRLPPAGWAVVPTASLVAAAAVLTTLNSDVYNAALWRAGEMAVARGVPAGEVDAGLEWVGAHTAAPIAAAPPGLPPYEPWYAAMEPGFEECAVVSARPLGYPKLALIGAEVYDTLGVAAPATLWVYRAGC